MMSIRLLLPILTLLLLSACTPRIYGIREDIWVTMSEPERLVAIDAYKERQIAIQRANEARAQQQRLELERLRQLREEEEARHRARIEAFYHGDHHYGDLLRVRLQGGTMHINGRSRAFRPVVFTIAEGEIRTISVYATNGAAVDLQVAYINGRLYLDGEPASHASRTARLALSLDWGLGHIYAGVNTRNVVSLANVEIYVEIVDTRHYDLRRSQLPAIVIHRDARRERFDQYRLDTVQPPRLSWPDRRDQQLDRREMQLDQRERQMDREQNQLERKEMMLDRKEQQLDRQRIPDRRPQVPDYRTDVPEYRTGTPRQPEHPERPDQPEQSRRHEQQQMRDRRPELERPALAPQPPAPPVVAPAPAPVAPRTPHQAAPPARDTKPVADRIKVKEQKGQAKKAAAGKVEKKAVQAAKPEPEKAAAPADAPEPEPESHKAKDNQDNNHDKDERQPRNVRLY